MQLNLNTEQADILSAELREVIDRDESQSSERIHTLKHILKKIRHDPTDQSLPLVENYEPPAVELTKLRAAARFQRLGSLKYLLICGLIFLTLAGIEVLRYKQFQTCLSDALSQDTSKPAFVSMPNPQEIINELSPKLRVSGLDSLTPDEIRNLDYVIQLRKYFPMFPAPPWPPDFLITRALSDKLQFYGLDSLTPDDIEKLEQIIRYREYDEYQRTVEYQRTASSWQQDFWSWANAKCHASYRYDIFKWFSWIDRVETAHAEMKFGNYSENDIRGIVIISIFFCMGLFFFMSTAVGLFVANKVRKRTEMIPGVLHDNRIRRPARLNHYVLLGDR